MTQQQLQASANTPDPPVMPIFTNNPQCPKCGDLWQQSSKTANVLAGATAVLAAPVVAIGEGATAIIQTGQSLMYNPSFISFVTDFASGIAPMTTAPITYEGILGVETGVLIDDWSQ